MIPANISQLPPFSFSNQRPRRIDFGRGDALDMLTPIHPPQHAPSKSGEIPHISRDTAPEKTTLRLITMGGSATAAYQIPWRSGQSVCTRLGFQSSGQGRTRSGQGTQTADGTDWCEMNLGTISVFNLHGQPKTQLSTTLPLKRHPTPPTCVAEPSGQ